MKLGRVERIEFEYIRHGVVALIANWHIAKGQVITPTVGTTRTEEDFCEHINKTIETDPEAGWIFLVDQLNIHQSESLVRLVAQRLKTSSTKFLILLTISTAVWLSLLSGNLSGFLNPIKLVTYFCQPGLDYRYVASIYLSHTSCPLKQY
jgi:hypothetical protein